MVSVLIDLLSLCIGHNNSVETNKASTIFTDLKRQQQNSIFVIEWTREKSITTDFDSTNEKH